MIVFYFILSSRIKGDIWTFTVYISGQLRNVKDWPNARNISTQHLATLLHDVATCVARGGQTHATFSSFSTQHVNVIAFGPWRARSGPNAHALAQQCRVNVVKRVQHHATSKMLHKKFDRFQIWSNIIQHVATYRNMVAKRMQHVVPNNVARCCVEMLRAFGQAFKVTLRWLCISNTSSLC